MMSEQESELVNKSFVSLLSYFIPENEQGGKTKAVGYEYFVEDKLRAEPEARARIAPED